MPYYTPVLLAKQLATLDHVSDGRLDVGVGIGWSEDEYDAVNVPFRQRGRRGDEFLKALKAIWTQDEVEFEGEFYRIPRSRILPKPVQKPHPPITVGGYSPVVVTRAVTLGDGFNGGNVPLDRVTPVVREPHAAAVAAGRDPARRSVVSRGSYHVLDAPQGKERRPLWGSLDEIRDDIRRYADAGADRAVPRSELPARRPVARPRALAHGCARSPRLIDRTLPHPFRPTPGGFMSIRVLFRSLAIVPLVVALVIPAAAQDKPRHGGELVFVVPAEPPSYDGHREGTFAMVHPVAPHYNTLLRVDPTDRSGTKVIGDLAESWTISQDSKTYTLKLRRGVKFHDGSDMTSRDVKASYDKIVNPPAGVTSFRKAQYTDVDAVEAPDANTIVFRLKWPSASFLNLLASPYSWIYKADILAKDVRWYEKNVMGTGPFVFGEYVKGSHWVSKKNPNYWDKGKPYLDGYRAIFIKDNSAQVAAVRAERAHAQFRGFTPAERDAIVSSLGSKATVQESAWDCRVLVSPNHEKKPWDDKRARRALSLALDRYQAAQALSRIAIVKFVAGVMVPETPFATPPAELEKLAGFGRDVAKARAEAKKLLREAGVPDGYSFTLKSRAVPMPYEPVGIWLVDQWRQIGLNVKLEFNETSKFLSDLREGNFEVSQDANCGYTIEPDLALFKFLSTGVSDNNYGRYKDPVLDDLYQQQSRTMDVEARKRLVRQFEKRLLDDEAHYVYTHTWYRIIPHSAKLKGWTITPSHFLNQQLDQVWLAE